MQRQCLEVQAVQRALDILEVVGNSVQPVSLKELAYHTALPKSTAYRLLGNLEHRGYVRCSGDGSYQLGLKLLMMSQRVEQAFELKHLVRPFLLELNERFKETVHLGVLEQNRVLYVDSVESPQPIRLVAETGSTNAAYCTSLGKALLIRHSDEAIRQILTADGMQKRTDYTITAEDAFFAAMAQTRQLGYALDNMESAPECRCVGAPIYNHRGQAVAAISISGPATRFSLTLIANEAAPELLEDSRQISRFLGLMQESRLSGGRAL
ncbi:IclR family transcriptional regulator [Acetonema longum]|uniref:Glycerol operon regulatory protein n=1 Tax=Acetonema longum DSM 6540 TaxID=1009370 RepID=F7NG16_9FIRM|nr:IclR family transcriptional regulator [Acetonema longum]EGO64934.1 IclR family transcriptional regulator [Acetonema longum DSM 6540]